MEIVKELVYQSKKLINLFYKAIKKTRVCRTRVGFKVYNPRTVSYSEYIVNSHKPLKVSCEHLYLGIDALTDKYTLVDTPLKESPHYFLMKDIANGNHLFNSEYVLRMSSGTLDERKPINIESRRIERLIKTFKKRQEELKSRKVHPVYIYEINGKQYVYDGKHRAALCLFLGYETIECLLLRPEIILHDFHIDMYKEMIKYPNEYNINLQFMNRLICK